jgi:tetratricopeptide (TPR) repeat protein
VRLFIERANSALAGFTVTESNAPAIAQICFRLDGIPLAIELAAVRVKALVVEKIAERLDDRFRLLTAGSRMVLPRHQTLRAMIDWSHDLLSGSERVLFRRLAVFAGGFTLEAAEAICSDRADVLQPGTGFPQESFLEETDILEPLMHLVEKSLVNLEERGGEARYQLLETIRQYGTEKLHESGELEYRIARHLTYYLQFAEAIKPDPLENKKELWSEEFESEHENLRSALDWSARNEVEKGLQLVRALLNFWTRRGYWSEGRDWISRFLHLPESSKPTRARAIILRNMRSFHLTDDHPIFGKRHLLAWHEESVVICRGLGEPGELAESLLELGRVLFLINGEIPRAKEIFEESLSIYQSTDNKRGVAGAQNMLGDIALNQGDIEQARTRFTRSLLIARELNLRGTWALGNLGMLFAFYEGNLVSARALFEEAIAVERKSGYPGTLIWLLHQLADVAGRQGDFKYAHACLEESMIIAQEINNNGLLSTDYYSQAKLALIEGNCDLANELFKRSHLLLTDEAETLTLTLLGLAKVATRQGKTDRAIWLFGKGMALVEELTISLTPIERTDIENELAELVASLDEAAFNLAWAEGRAMTLEQARDFALEGFKVSDPGLL